MQVQIEIKSKNKRANITETATDIFKLAKKYGAWFDGSNVSVQRHPRFTKLTIYPNGPFRALESQIVLVMERPSV